MEKDEIARNLQLTGFRPSKYSRVTTAGGSEIEDAAYCFRTTLFYIGLAIQKLDAGSWLYQLHFEERELVDWSHAHAKPTGGICVIQSDGRAWMVGRGGFTQKFAEALSRSVGCKATSFDACAVNAGWGRLLTPSGHFSYTILYDAHPEGINSIDVCPVTNETGTGPPVHYEAFANFGHTPLAMYHWYADFLLLQLTPQLSSSEAPLVRSVAMSTALPSVSA